MFKHRINLETKRLILRPFKKSDAQTVCDLAGDRKIADTTISIPYPYKLKMADEWILTHKLEFQKGRLITYAITLKEKGELIGCIGLTVNKTFNRAELGYWIGVPYWGLGYCTEATEKLINYSFETFLFNKINAHHLKRNPASGRVLEKIGMKFEGTLRDHIKKWDNYEDVCCYGILQKEKNRGDK